MRYPEIKLPSFHESTDRYIQSSDPWSCWHLAVDNAGYFPNCLCGRGSASQTTSSTACETFSFPLYMLLSPCSLARSLSGGTLGRMYTDDKDPKRSNNHKLTTSRNQHNASQFYPLYTQSTWNITCTHSVISLLILELLQVEPVTQNRVLWDNWRTFLQARCPSNHPEQQQQSDGRKSIEEKPLRKSQALRKGNEFVRTIKSQINWYMTSVEITNFSQVCRGTLTHYWHVLGYRGNTLQKDLNNWNYHKHKKKRDGWKKCIHFMP